MITKTVCYRNRCDLGCLYLHQGHLRCDKVNYRDHKFHFSQENNNVNVTNLPLFII